MMAKKKKRGRGQPELPEVMKRKPVMVRLNAKERKKLERLAKKAGLPLSTYIREAALGNV
jgi:uncharacterized protein YbaP (TraB family)